MANRNYVDLSTFLLLSFTSHGLETRAHVLESYTYYSKLCVYWRPNNTNPAASCLFPCNVLLVKNNMDLQIRMILGILVMFNKRASSQKTLDSGHCLV